MHDLVGLYAARRLYRDCPAAERDAAFDRLVRHYLDSLLAANTHVDPRAPDARSAAFADRTEALEWLESEQLNLLLTPLRAPAAGVAFSLALFPYLHLQRRHRTWLRLSEQARAAEDGQVDDSTATMLLGFTGTALRAVGEVAEALLVQRRVAETFRRADDRRGEAVARLNLGNSLAEAGEAAGALAAHERARALSLGTGDLNLAAKALDHIGQDLHGAGRTMEAIAAHREAAGTLRELGDHRGRATALTNLSTVLWSSGRVAEAVDAISTAIGAFTTAGDQQGRADALTNHAVYLAADRPEAAVPLAEEAVALCRRSDDPARLGRAQLNLARALVAAARLEEAVLPAREALEVFDTNGSPAEQASALGALMAALGPHHPSAEVLDLAVRAEALHARLGDDAARLPLLLTIGTALCETGDPLGALAPLETAAGLARTAGDTGTEAEALLMTGIALMDAGRPEQALDVLARADEVLRAGISSEAEAEAAETETAELRTRVGLARGCILAELRRFEEAVPRLRATADGYRALGDLGQEALTRTWLGLALEECGDVPAAAHAHQDAVAAYSDLRDVEGTLGAVANLVRCLLALGRLTEAEEYLHWGSALNAMRDDDG